MTQKRHPPFSVIIPTLWRPATFIALLERLDACEDVQEILVIDNARDQRPDLPELNKLRIIDMGENQFVNPSWNLGVELSKSTALCLCNDDVLFADDLLGFMRCQSLRLIIGLDSWSYSQPIDNPPHPRVTLGAEIIHNWGSMLFFLRQRYRPVPHALKIWWGDAWLAQEMGPALKVRTAVSTKHSVTAGSPEFKDITARDTKLWEHQFRKAPSLLHRLHRRLRALFLFSEGWPSSSHRP